jgi:hypothetical protein
MDGSHVVYLELAAQDGITKAIKSGWCECPAGIAGNCTHIAALLHTAADMVHSAGRVPGEEQSFRTACTSQDRAWGLPAGKMSDDVCKPLREFWFCKGDPDKLRSKSQQRKRADGCSSYLDDVDPLNPELFDLASFARHAAQLKEVRRR